MHAHHLHSGIEEEDAACQDYIVEFRQVGEEALAHIHIVVTSCRQVQSSKDDEKSGRDDGSDESTPFAYLAHPA